LRELAEYWRGVGAKIGSDGTGVRMRTPALILTPVLGRNLTDLAAEWVPLSGGAGGSFKGGIQI
jgi:hypothetical protein